MDISKKDYIGIEELDLKLKNYSLNLSILFFLSSITCFFAYNWDFFKKFGNIVKVSIPMFLIFLCILCWFTFQHKELYRKLFLFTGAFLIGTLFAVFGQVYQTGADAYTLFINWGIFILTFSFVEKFYPLWSLNITAFTLGILFYVRTNFSIKIEFLISGLFLVVILGGYSFILKKYKLEFNKWFYSYISLLSITLLTVDGFIRTTEITQLFFIYLFGILLISYLEFKITGVKNLNAFIILSLEIVSIKFLLSLYYENPIIVLHISIIMLAIGIHYIFKNLKTNLKDSLVAKIISFILKIFLILTVLVFVFLNLASLLGEFTDLILLFSGFLGIFLSIILPRILEFKENKIEFVSFFIGIILLLFHLNIKFDFNIDWIVNVLIFWSIFAIVYIFIYSKVLDFFIIPVIILGCMLINVHFQLFALPLTLIIIFIPLLFKNVNNKIKRIGKGGEFTVFALIIFSSYIFTQKNIIANISNHFSEPMILFSIMNRVIYISDLFAFFVLFKIIYSITKNKKWIISIGTLLFIIPTMGLLSPYFKINNFVFIFYIAHFFSVIKYSLIFLLLYILRKEKNYEHLALTILIALLINYYYKLSTTLLIKSYSLLAGGLFLFVGYILLKKHSKDRLAKLKEVI